jgi:hypothetical protein
MSDVSDASRDGEGSNNAVYEVGYKKPPKHTQWQKGYPSPNPSGRPKRQLTLADFVAQHMQTRVTVREGGKKKRLTKLELTAIKLVNDAVLGDKASLKLIQALAAPPEPEQVVDEEITWVGTMILEDNHPGPGAFEYDKNGNIIAVNQPPSWWKLPPGRK